MVSLPSLREFGVGFVFCLAEASCLACRRDGLVRKLVCLEHGVKHEEFSYQFPLILENSSDTVGKRSGKLVNSNSICMRFEDSIKISKLFVGFEAKTSFLF